MKKLFLLTACVLMSCLTFSQGLTPQIQFLESDTIFCFTLPQSRIIATHLESGLYCDSILIESEAEINCLNQSIIIKDTIINLLEKENANRERINLIQDAELNSIKLEYLQINKRFEKQRLHKWLFVAGFFAVSFVAIIK